MTNVMDFKELINTLTTKPSSKLLPDIIQLLDEQISQSNSSFILESINELLILKHWSWQQLSHDYHQWIYQPNYFALFISIASLNQNLIFNDDEQINTQIKLSLLIPDSIEQINGVLEQIDNSNDDNCPFIIIINHWFDNLSFFIREQSQFDKLPVISHLNKYLSYHFLMTNQFQIYLSNLVQREINQSIYSARQLFYMKTCSFSLASYLSADAQKFSFTPNQIFEHIGEDYLRMMILHSQTISSWNEELCSCIAHISALIHACCLWGGEKSQEMSILFPTERILCEFAQALIQIISYEPFYQAIQPKGENNETILINSTLKLTLFLLFAHKMTWFFRSNPTFSNTIMIIAENSVFDEICLCSHAILGEILTDDRLKELQVTEDMCVIFLNILNQGWQHPLKKYRHIPILELLQGFLSLTKSDAIKENIARLDCLPLLIEMSDEYPIVYDILWAISFNQDIQRQLRSNSNFMSKLTHLANECEDQKIRKMTHGLLWNLKINHKDVSKADVNYQNTFDIMISYSHKDTNLSKQIYDELVKAGYHVWIDFDQMHGNIMDAMTQAIEQSRTVIICISENYRKSNYCRAEAQYAFQRQRKIVPVLLQKHYKPDGWLLFLIGQLLYVDFTKYEFAQAIEMLFKELKDSDTVHLNKIVIETKPSVIDALPKLNLTPILPSNILDWTEVHVQSWLNNHHFIHLPELLRKCDGPSIVHLNEYIKNGDTSLVLKLLQEESLENTGKTLCLTELSRFRSLMNEQTPIIDLNTSIRANQSDNRTEEKGCCQCCLMM